MNPFCSVCYKPDAGKRCGRCFRRYCSSECQVQDWQEKGHKKLCGKVGQLGKDFEIKPSPEKGLGVFALRDIKMGEIILQDRRIDPNTTNQHAVALLALMKQGNSGFDETCPLIFRVNNDCIGNAIRMPSEKVPGISILKAGCDIRAEEEIGYMYPFRNPQSPRLDVAVPKRADRITYLKEMYGFECRCKACTDPAIEDKITQLNLLSKKHDRDDSVMIEVGKTMVSIVEELGTTHPGGVAQMLVPQFAYLMRAGREAEAKQVAEKALRLAAIWHDDPNDPVRTMVARMVSDPQGSFRALRSTLHDFDNQT